jgi:hypothetical protein
MSHGWRNIVGRYACRNYATAELFVRGNRLYCLCSPLHETRLIPRAADIFLQRDGLFAGEPLQIYRSAAQRVTGLAMGGMRFSRLEEV